MFGSGKVKIQEDIRVDKLIRDEKLEMRDKEKWKIKLQNILDELIKYKPKKIIFFGSRSRGDYKKNSDIDIAVDLKLFFRNKRKLRDKIDTLAGLYSVDLIFLDEIENDFKEKLLKEGKIIYE